MALAGWVERVDTERVRSYGQFCPIARGSEVLAERWTPIILRNVLLGCRTFNEIAAGAPGLARALLTRRLRELARAGVIEIRPKPGGRGSLYEPTPQGRELWDVLRALGGWAERWMEVTPEQAEPDVVLWSWCESFLARDLLPDRRVVIRFADSLPRDARAQGRLRRPDNELDGHQVAPLVAAERSAASEAALGDAATALSACSARQLLPRPDL